VAQEQQASKKIEAVKGLLPKALTPPGHGNPIGTLYAALSGGLHAGTDEECLELATNLRAALEFLLRVLGAHEKATEAYAGALQSIQTKTQPPKPAQLPAVEKPALLPAIEPTAHNEEPDERVGSLEGAAAEPSSEPDEEKESA
jgi:hypothetical protein